MNKAIRRPVYTIPTIEEKLPLLKNAKVFTTVDVSEAFHTIELDDESALLTTFMGPDGRYCFTRRLVVFVKPSPRKRSKPWIHGEVVNKPAPRSCTVSTPLGLVRRNHAQIRKASTDPVHGYSEPVSIDTDAASDTSEQVDDPSSPNSGGAAQVKQPEYVNPEHHASPEIVLRRSSRNRKLSSRFKDYVMNIS